MYLNHWNLNQAPLANVPAGSMFYRSPQHEEALQRLLYVIESRRGVAMLTGEVGCGTTTVIKALASQLKKDAVQFHMISNPALPPKQLLQTIMLKLGAEMPPTANRRPCCSTSCTRSSPTRPRPGARRSWRSTKRT